MRQLVLFSFLLVYSCNSVEKAGIDPRLDPFIDLFILEASKRNIKLLKSELDAVFVEELSADVGESTCGYGWSDYRGRRRVEIKNTEDCWFSRSDREKENFLFHELGHAMLGRDHDNETFQNGYPRSVMCDFQEGVNCNNYQTMYAGTREYYLDELFNESTNSPGWTNAKGSETILIRDTIDDGNWEFIIVGDDENISEYYFDEDSLIMGSRNVSVGNSYIIMLQRVEVQDFEDCALLRGGGRLKLDSSITVGYLEVSLSLRERLEDDELSRFALNRRPKNSPAAGWHDLKLDLYCMPEETDVVTLAFVYQSDVPNEVRLYEQELSIIDQENL